MGIPVHVGSGIPLYNSSVQAGTSFTKILTKSAASIALRVAMHVYSSLLRACLCPASL